MTRGQGTSIGHGLVALILALGLSSAATAAESDQCIMSTTTLSEEGEMGHFRVDAPRDLGGGFVMDHLQSSTDGAMATTARFEHCATGRSIEATILRVTWEKTYEAPADPTALVSEAIRSPETFTLDDVAEMLRSHGIETETRSSDFESCGCAVFYPHLRGDRTPWPG